MTLKIHTRVRIWYALCWEGERAIEWRCCVRFSFDQCLSPGILTFLWTNSPNKSNRFGQNTHTELAHRCDSHYLPICNTEPIQLLSSLWWLNQLFINRYYDSNFNSQHCVLAIVSGKRKQNGSIRYSDSHHAAEQCDARNNSGFISLGEGDETKGEYFASNSWHKWG